MIILINGSFASGKTTTAELLVQRLYQSMLYDPEMVGIGLAHIVKPIETFTDFQDLTAWRPLVVETARVLKQVKDRTGYILAIERGKLLTLYRQMASCSDPTFSERSESESEQPKKGQKPALKRIAGAPSMFQTLAHLIKRDTINLATRIATAQDLQRVQIKRPIKRSRLVSPTEPAARVTAKPDKQADPN